LPLVRGSRGYGPGVAEHALRRPDGRSIGPSQPDPSAAHVADDVLDGDRELDVGAGGRIIDWPCPSRRSRHPESFETCQRGAGRAMSRTAARKGKISDKAYAEMAELGVTLPSRDPKTIAEEVAFAYKDIEAVMAASASFVRPVRRLTPLGVVKG
jgi:hypothetical protein